MILLEWYTRTDHLHTRPTGPKKQHSHEPPTRLFQHNTGPLGESQQSHWVVREDAVIQREYQVPRVVLQ